MTSINVRLGDGTQLTIKEGDKYSDLVKNNKLEKLAPLFDLIDNSGSGDGDRVVNGKELELIKTALEKMDGNIDKYDIDKYCKDIIESGNVETFIKTNTPAKKTVISQDGKTSQGAFNQYIQNLGNKFDKAALEGEFKGTTHKIVKGDTLYRIAKDALGENATNRTINEKIAQIAVLNNIKDVNNVPIGTELKIITGTKTPAAPVAAPVKKTPESSIKVNTNGVDSSWGNGEDVADHAGVKKFTKGEGENAETIYRMEVNGVKLTGATVEEVEKKKQDYEAAAVTAKPADETDEAAKTRKANNLEALKKRIEVSGGNAETLKQVVADLKNSDLTDNTSAEFKVLVKELILTKNPEVLANIMPEFDKLVENDEDSHRAIAGLYKEIRDKEKAGTRLSDEEHALKEILAKGIAKGGTILERNKEGEATLRLDYDGEGNVCYLGEFGDLPSYTAIAGRDKELVKEFQAKYNEAVAETDTAQKEQKLQALYTEYKGKTDPAFVASVLALNASEFKAKKEDILEVINNNTLESLSWIDISHLSDEDKKEVYTKLANKAVQEFTAEGKGGNLENTQYIEKAFEWINNSNLNDDNKAATKKQILDSYFKIETSKDENGNEVKRYKFEPSRRPTYDEMYNLAIRDELSESQNLALIKSIKYEDMGAKEYNAALESCMENRIVPHYAEMVDKMTTREEVFDFINNKATADRDWNLPYDKIMEKFPDDKEILNSLGKYMSNNSVISNANKLALAKNFMQIDANGNVAFDPSKLPEDVTTHNILDTMLPKDCTKGEAAKYYKAIINSIKENGNAFLSAINNHRADSDTQKIIDTKIKEFVLDTTKAGADEYNRLALYAYNTGKVGDADMQQVFEASSDAMKAKFINSGYTRSETLVVVKSGDSIDKIVKNYLANHLDKFPKLKNSVESNSSKWTAKRINEALDDYMQEFRESIQNELGIDDPTKLKARQIIDLAQINWEKHQPNWLAYTFRY